MSSSRCTYETYVHTPPEKLWRALTEPEFTRHYRAETWQEADWQPGSSWRLMIPDGRVGDTGEVLDLEPVGTSVKLTFTQEREP